MKFFVAALIQSSKRVQFRNNWPSSLNVLLLRPHRSLLFVIMGLIIVSNISNVISYVSTFVPFMFFCRRNIKKNNVSLLWVSFTMILFREQNFVSQRSRLGRPPNLALNMISSSLHKICILISSDTTIQNGLYSTSNSSPVNTNVV